MKNNSLRTIAMAGLAGLCPFGASAIEFDQESDPTAAQIGVLPGQDIRNYASWDPAKANVPAFPLPASILADTGLIAEGSNPGSNNIFRTRVFDVDFTGVPIPPCPDGSVADAVNVVVDMQFTGDQPNGVGVDLFARIFTNGDTVLDGIDLVGDQVNGTQTVKFKQLVPVSDLDSVQLMISFQTLEAGSLQFNWTLDSLDFELSPDCPVTGDAELDFPVGSPNTAVVSDPGGFDVTVHSSAPEGTISGWDASDVRFRYDPIDDLMYVAVNTLTPGGDADGNGDPGLTSSWLGALGGIDLPDYRGSEAVVVLLDVDQDGTGDVVLGTPPSQSINEFEVARFNAFLPPIAAPFGFAGKLANHTGEVLNVPGSFVPGEPTNPSDLIMTIRNWSTLPTSGGSDDSVRSFSYVMYQGSAVDLGVGEEWSPGVGEFGPVEIPEVSVAVGSIGNLVWKDSDEDGFFDEGEEFGIPGVVVTLLNSDGNEIGQQITDEDGAYLFTDLPEGLYTVKVADSNFDDCGQPHYKSGKWALGDGLEYNGSNVTYQPNIMAIDGNFSITAQVQPALGEWMTVVEKGNDPWPYALWISPEGEIHLGIDNGSGLEYVNSVGTLTGALEHIAVTFDGSSTSFYINGILDSTVPFAATLDDTVGDLYIGRNFTGKINDVRIYNSAISAEIVSGLASMECGALVDYYQTTVIGGLDDNTNKELSFDYNLSEGEDYFGADFGFNELGSIGNTVWCEEDGDGYFEPQNGEEGIPGVEVVLKDAAGEVLATVLTDADGQYLFEGLPAGTYSVEVPVSGSNVECLPALASIDQVSTGESYEIVDNLERGDTFYVDRGYVVNQISTTLSEARFIKAANDDRNLVIDDHLTFTLAGDAEVYLAFYGGGHKPSWLGAEGWTRSYDESIRITNGYCNWNYVIYSKSFPAGQVTLDGPGECAPMYGAFVDGEVCGSLIEKTATTPQDSDTGDGASRISPHVVNLGSGQDYILADFGFQKEDKGTCIGNLVYYDCDGDGLYEPDQGEYGICGVRILLKDSSGCIVGVTYTDSEGAYLFEDLEPGCYTVIVSSRNFQCGAPLYRNTQVVDRSDEDGDNFNRCQSFCVCIEEGDCYIKADFGFLNWCNYRYCNSYWRYNYRTRCWEHRNRCNSNCWRAYD